MIHEEKNSRNLFVTISFMMLVGHYSGSPTDLEGLSSSEEPFPPLVKSRSLGQLLVSFQAALVYNLLTSIFSVPLKPVFIRGFAKQLTEQLGLKLFDRFL
jgi:hypothetical protein